MGKPNLTTCPKNRKYYILFQGKSPEFMNLKEQGAE